MLGICLIRLTLNSAAWLYSRAAIFLPNRILCCTMTCAFKRRKELYSQWRGNDWKEEILAKTKKQARAETKLVSAQSQILVKKGSERSDKW